MGCFLQSTFGKYLLVETVETKDRDGEEAEQMPDKYGTGYDDHHPDYPEDWGLGKGFDYASGKKKRDPYAFGLGK